MGFAILADLTLAFHLGFIAFVLGGGFLVGRWPRLATPHLAAAAWGAFVAMTGRVCPLTPLEIWLRERAGQSGYRGGFIEHYLTRIIYPEGLTPELQCRLGVLVVAVNLGVYAWVARGRRGR